MTNVIATRPIRAAAGHPIAACLMSGDTDQTLIAQARDSALTLLHKPVRPAKLRSLLRSLTATSQPVEVLPETLPRQANAA